MSVSRSASRTIMKAIRVAQFGGPEMMKVEANLAIPKPSEKQILIKVSAAGVNPVDTYIRAGTYAKKPDLPYTPGSDVGGVVEEVGSAVTKFKKGDRVFTVRTDTGGYGEYTLTDSGLAGLLDDKLSLEQGAAIGVPYFTAYRAVVTHGKAKTGETILVHGASGAVGLACVQIAKAHGLRVVGTAGTQEGLDLVTSLGAEAVVNHRGDNYTQTITAACGGSGPNLIIEMLANVNLEKDLQMAAQKGRIIIVGSRGTVEVTPRLTMGKELTVQGLMLMGSTAEEWDQMHAGIKKGMAAGWLKPHIGHTYTLEQAPQAHDDIINTKGATGKLILKI
ncbi:quinone oxidoreductase-like [Mizuhopecten yessoensis]|uniref:Quinone oxidoreductase n=1 Tax=Mizuhopecten yessoensis TaxID=6573 RepID=A0A210PLN1_MIZYE|nr:quinone oxidoreductase-like [Mizuhopecten yessoensis]XP_021380230.1 quinone oxidoreductase-like [Mizuhopecten yessoensis]XP_021380231.1 quinone oxidoreductase-like [Mizuhopecten yessoensis]XP_021380232.1 quinone oxidoreductase-like [Mizuhopecten yessoensis]XP_021380233.1 quinone oxidoreductase-like [Mizuhopecten yessoensis]OWF37409.1 Quinone oxidoreductase [Mizuhopecten yessoensis]